MLRNEKLNLENRHKVIGMQRLVICSKFYILFDYLNKFPLKSNKIISYKRFKRVYEYKLLNEEDYLKILNNPKAFLKLQNLIKSINNHDL